MRKWLMLLLILALAQGGALAAVSVRMDDAAALLGEDGSEIVSVGAFGDIVDLDGGLFAAEREGRYALMDALGSLLTEAVYEDLRPSGEFLLAKRDGGWGMLGLDGTEIGAFVWTQLVSTGAGGCWAWTGRAGELEAAKLYVLDASGRAREAGVEAYRLGEAGEGGLLPVQLDGGLWGYCGADGQLTIEARFDYAGPFVNGCAAVVQDGRYGAIDASGAYVADPDYDFLEVSQAGFILAARRGEGAWAIRLDGSEIRLFEGEELSVALVGDGFLAADADALRVYDADGALLAELGADAAVYEGLDGQLILSEGMWGERCVGILGEEARQQNLYPLGYAGGSAVYASMSANVARYMNDLLGEIQLSVDMDTARYGLADSAGEELLPCEYELIQYLADDRFLVYAQGRWRMIDSSGCTYWSRAARRTAAPNS